jgi:hypothetical protein
MPTLESNMREAVVAYLGAAEHDDARRESA